MGITNKTYNDALIKYLETHSPEDWHQVASNWNWDNGTEPLLWIVQNPDCDRGTALLIFWFGAGPEFTNKDQVSDYQKNNTDLIGVIVKNYTSGFYKNENIYFNPQAENDNWVERYEDNVEKNHIPEILLEPSKGKEIKNKYLEDGYPEEVLKEVEG